jgi:hypothetical protein
MFCRLLDSDVFGQILLMREYEDDKEKVKFMVAVGGAVQSIDISLKTEEMADTYFNKVDLKEAELRLQPLIGIGMVQG